MTTKKKKQGFASMKPEQQKIIASKGGKAAHKKGVAYKWTSEIGRLAGIKGWEARMKKIKKS